MNAPSNAFTIAVDHPCLEGHFPGRPLVPAVVLLEMAFKVIVEQLGQPMQLCGISAAKFLRPVSPGEAVSVSFERDTAANAISFRCTTAGGLVAQGRFVTVAAP
jgi:3-hydroxymyristoyl/3-hydroxydecanoyl-(acyl carrier protein) dehydratase